MTTESTARDLCFEIADIITKQPHRFDMDTWADGEGAFKKDPDTGNTIVDTNICGTTCCVAGWAAALTNNGLVDIDRAFDIGKEKLGLSKWGAEALFVSCTHADPDDIAETLRELGELSDEERKGDPGDRLCANLAARWSDV